MTARQGDWNLPPGGAYQSVSNTDDTAVFSGAHSPPTTSLDTGRARCLFVTWEIAALALLVLIDTAFLLNRVFEGALEVRHFTYWGLMSVAAFGWAWLLAYEVDRRAGVSHLDTPGGYEEIVLSTTAVPIIAVQGLVVVLISAIPIFDENILLALADGTALGVANLGNIMVHYLPFVILVFVLQRRSSKWTRGMRSLFTGKDLSAFDSAILRESFIFAQAGAFPASLSGVYSSVFDFNSAYEVDVPHGYVYATGMVFITLFYLVVRMLSSHMWPMGTTRA